MLQHEYITTNWL